MRTTRLTIRTHECDTRTKQLVVVEVMNDRYSKSPTDFPNRRTYARKIVRVNEVRSEIRDGAPDLLALEGEEVVNVVPHSASRTAAPMSPVENHGAMKDRIGWLRSELALVEV